MTAASGLRQRSWIEPYGPCREPVIVDYGSVGVHSGPGRPDARRIVVDHCSPVYNRYPDYVNRFVPPPPVRARPNIAMTVPDSVVDVIVVGVPIVGVPIIVSLVVREHVVAEIGVYLVKLPLCVRVYESPHIQDLAGGVEYPHNGNLMPEMLLHTGDLSGLLDNIAVVSALVAQSCPAVPVECHVVREHEVPRHKSVAIPPVTLERALENVATDGYLLLVIPSGVGSKLGYLDIVVVSTMRAESAQ